MAGASSPLTERPLFFFRRTHSIRTFTFFTDEMRERGRCGVALGVGRKELVMVGVLLAGTLLAVLNLTMLSPALPAIMSDLQRGCHHGPMAHARCMPWWKPSIIPLSAYLVGRFTTRQLFITALSRCSRRAASPRPWRRTSGYFCSGACMQAACTGAVHAHGVHGDPACVPSREARYGHGRHRAHHRLRPGGGAVAVGPSGGFRGLARAVRHCDGARRRRGDRARRGACCATTATSRAHVFRQAVGGAVHGGPCVPALRAFHLRFYDEYGAHAGAYRRGHRAGGLLCASSA